MPALARCSRDVIIDRPLETPLPRFRRDHRLLTDVRIAYAAQPRAFGDKPGSANPLGSSRRSWSFIDARREGGRA